MRSSKVVSCCFLKTRHDHGVSHVSSVLDVIVASIDDGRLSYSSECGAHTVLYRVFP